MCTNDNSNFISLPVSLCILYSSRLCARLKFYRTTPDGVGGEQWRASCILNFFFRPPPPVSIPSKSSRPRAAGSISEPTRGHRSVWRVLHIILERMIVVDDRCLFKRARRAQGYYNVLLCTRVIRVSVVSGGAHYTYWNYPSLHRIMYYYLLFKREQCAMRSSAVAANK